MDLGGLVSVLTSMPLRTISETHMMSSNWQAVMKEAN